MFRHGADMSEKLKQGDVSLSGQLFYDNERLRELPCSWLNGCDTMKRTGLILRIFVATLGLG